MIGSLVVVRVTPVIAHTLELFQGFKKIVIQHFVAEGPIKALNEGVLCRLARLDMQQTHLHL